MFTNICRLLICVFLLLMVTRQGFCVEDKRFKVLVVMSYNESYQWENEIREGIESILADFSELEYVYLDSKNNYSGAAEKARKLFELYQQIMPDGVIAVDDSAQALFVVPYLKNKVTTPVMFCGVNGHGEDYGYPATNVSGVLERLYMKETLAFLKQLVPSVKTFCAVLKKDDTSRGILQQLQYEAEAYPMRLVTTVTPVTYQDALAAAGVLRTKCDALFLTPLDGLPGESGKPLSSREIMPALIKTFSGPTFTGVSNDLRSGILCSVLKTGQEQGVTAAKMLLLAMRGTPVDQLPIRVNRNGKRVINVTAMKALGISARPVILRGAELITTAE